MYEKVYFRMHKGTMIKKQNSAKKKKNSIYIYIIFFCASFCMCMHQRCPVCQGKKKNVVSNLRSEQLLFFYMLFETEVKGCADILLILLWVVALFTCNYGTNLCTPSTSIDVLRHVAIVYQNCGSIDKSISSASLWFGKTSYSSTKPFIIYCQNLKCSFPLYINQA